MHIYEDGDRQSWIYFEGEGEDVDKCLDDG